MRDNPLWLNRVTTDAVRQGSALGASKDRADGLRQMIIRRVALRCAEIADEFHDADFGARDTADKIREEFGLPFHPMTGDEAEEAGRTEYERVTHNPKDGK